MRELPTFYLRFGFLSTLNRVNLAIYAEKYGKLTKGGSMETGGSIGKVTWKYMDIFYML